MLQVEKTKLDGVLMITPATVFEDFRGCYIETYNKKMYHDAGVAQKFIQDDISISTQHVLRGIHGDRKTWKLVSCLRGTFYLVVVNYDETSEQFGQWQGFTLSDSNHKQVLILPNFGNGHVVMSPEAIFHYKQTTYYDRAEQFTINWRDPRFNFWWPVKTPITSIRDEGEHG